MRGGGVGGEAEGPRGATIHKQPLYFVSLSKPQA